MKDISINRLVFHAHVKYLVMSGILGGFGIGIVGLIISLFNIGMTISIRGTEYFGVSAGIAGFFLSPVYSFAIAAIGGVISYIPLLLFMKIKKRIKLNYIDDIQED